MTPWLRAVELGIAAAACPAICRRNCPTAVQNSPHFFGPPQVAVRTVAIPGGFAVGSNRSPTHKTINQGKMMKPFKLNSAIAFAGIVFLALPVLAGPQAKTYQVTGPILELTDTTIVVQKGEEKWQVARDKGTKVNGELKVGAKVTIQYRCVAVDVEVKAEKAEKKSP